MSGDVIDNCDNNFQLNTKFTFLLPAFNYHYFTYSLQFDIIVGINLLSKKL